MSDTRHDDPRKPWTVAGEFFAEECPEERIEKLKEQAAELAQDYPKDQIPEHEDLPYGRDRFLPRPDLPGWGPPGAEPPVL